MKKIIFLIAISFVISACLPQGVRVPQSQLQPLLERKSGLIAYVGIDGNLYVSDQGGGKKKQFTKDAFFGQNANEPYLYYRALTWSKDSAHIAFVGENFDGKTNVNNILIANVEKGSAAEVFAHATEAPIYLYWSPDKENLSFISSAATGQNIILQSVPSGGGERTILDVGMPYYWSWAPNGRALITHAGGGSNASAPEHLSFIQLQDPGGEIIEDSLDAAPASFQAPAWSPDGSHIALTRVGDSNNEIILTDGAGVYQKTLGTFEVNAAFAWSEDSAQIAYIDGTQAMSAGVVGELNIVDMQTAEKISVGQSVIAFFWSPSGEKIAYFQLPPDSSQNSSGASSQFEVQLSILDVKSGESRELYTYTPTQQFANILPYFDQYHQSLTIWSPDDNSLVLSFMDSQGSPAIAIASASGNLQPRLLAEGYIAVWSWK